MEWGSFLGATVGALLGSAISAVAAWHISIRRNKFDIVLATWPKRIEVHQEAFKWWRECTNLTFNETGIREETIFSAQKFWRENCLYLSNELRSEFIVMTNRVAMHKRLRDARTPSDQLEENFDKIMRLGELIAKSVGTEVSESILKELAKKK